MRLGEIGGATTAGLWMLDFCGNMQCFVVFHASAVIGGGIRG